MTSYREFYVVKDGTTMLIVHPDTESEERAFRSEMREGISRIIERLDGLESRVSKIETTQTIMSNDINNLGGHIDHLRHVIYWAFAVIGIIIALWGLFAPIYTDIISYYRTQPIIQTAPVQVMPSSPSS